jgi:cytochrome c oxidase assembly factor CtaG
VPVVFDPPLAAVAVVAGLHALGERRATQLVGRSRATLRRWRAWSFYAGLAAIFAALATPIDTLSEKLFWVHMTQHVLLLTVAAPLIALGAPWMSIWRPLPLATRRALARSVARSRPLAPLRALGRLLARPIAAWIAFNVNLVLWHVPALYDLTLRDRTAHDLEHTTFLLFGVLLWAQVLDSPPLRARLSAVVRVYYITAAAAVSWLLSLVIALDPTPLYSAYAHLAHRPGGLSPLADQQIAAGVMLGPGSVAMTIYVFWGLYRWLGVDEHDAGGPSGGGRGRRRNRIGAMRVGAAQSRDGPS